MTWTTFHQSYSYEDFVEGLRPVLSEEQSEGIAYQIIPGVFRQICSQASFDPSNKYVLIIDEINRGNIAKIMGELITLLEEDKRKGESHEITLRLPYSQDQFSVPSNLYVIGTMNTADRSIALLDVALRRRFAFVEICPRSSLLEELLIETEEASINLQRLLDNLNAFISENIDPDHQIGHSYFLGLADVDESKRVERFLFIWKTQIFPLLTEYFYRQPEKINELLTPNIANEDESTDALNIESDDDLLFALMELSRR
jgi:5-methylcytosine-specific restriction protein B